MKLHLFFLAVALFLVFSCGSPEADHSSQDLYSAKSDSTLFYYQLGWKQIMDEGHYGPAEWSYRKALDFDDNFLVGKAVLARLTTDLEERLNLFETIQSNKAKITSNERLVLDVYNGLVHFTNLREQQPERAGVVIDSVLQLAEINLGKVVQSYPDDIYLRCEYFEIIYANHDASTALETMNSMCTNDQLMNPFLLGFAASLHAENGDYEMALNKAKILENQLDNKLPKSHAVYADIYFQMDSLDTALEYARTAVQLDPRNLDASRIVEKITSQQ